MIDIAEKINILCIKKKTTVAKLSEKMGNSRQNLSIKLKRNDMKLSDIAKVAENLDCEIELNFRDSGTKEILA